MLQVHLINLKTDVSILHLEHTVCRQHFLTYLLLFCLAPGLFYLDVRTLIHFHGLKKLAGEMEELDFFYQHIVICNLNQNTSSKTVALIPNSQIGNIAKLLSHVQ